VFLSGQNASWVDAVSTWLVRSLDENSRRGRASLLGVVRTPEPDARRAVDTRDQLLRCQHAEALGHQLADLVPVGRVVEHHADRVTTPSEHEERVAGMAQDLELLAF